MEPDELQQNLERLLQAMEAHAAGRDHAGLDSPDLANRLSVAMPLSHSLSRRQFAEVLRGGELLSQREQRLRHETASPAADPSTEARLGTDDDVFLYCGPFSCGPKHPPAVCGFLWQPELETTRAAEGEASPFDSGGLMKHFNLPNPHESRSAFLDRHRLPIPGHRTYLAKKLHTCCCDPNRYLTCVAEDGTGVDDPVVGLSGGDRRRWTHEVRIRRNVSIQDHLDAIFVPQAKARRESFLLARLPRRVRIRSYINAGSDFRILQQQSIDYIAEQVG
jgi:hypothetical protein